MELSILNALNLEAIEDPLAREWIEVLLNLLEERIAKERELEAEIQRLRDEIARLKGEQGKPNIKPGKKKGKQYGSERERRRPQRWKKKGKLAQIHIDREEKLELDKKELPEDAVFKGYEAVVVQDIKIETDNVRFLKSRYYSASEGKSYLARLPKGYEGEFGPGLRSLVLALYYEGRMTRPAIATFLRCFGIRISEGQISNLLVHKQEGFHEEKKAVLRAGLASSEWAWLDSTGMRWDGRNVYTHVLATSWCAVYTTTEEKNRQSLLQILQGGEERRYLLNEEALKLMEQMGLSQVKRQALKGLQCEEVWGAEAFLDYLEQQGPELGPQQRRQVLDAAAIAAYHKQKDWPVLQTLVTDDAREFQYLTPNRALCWVHEARHYKKLEPATPQQQAALEAFLDDYWGLYGRLRAYRQQPSEAQREALAAQFDQLFSRKTGYWRLDERIALTRAKRKQLLLVLEHPELPLHTNAVELAIRPWVRKRKISAGVRSEAGLKAWDTFHTLAATARKLGVSFYHYLYDRISQTYAMPSLADLIYQRAAMHPPALAPP